MAEPDAGMDAGRGGADRVRLRGLLTWQYERSWTEAERLYLSDYLKSGARGKASATASSKYTLLEAVVASTCTPSASMGRSRQPTGPWQSSSRSSVSRPATDEHAAYGVGKVGTRLLGLL